MSWDQGTRHQVSRHTVQPRPSTGDRVIVGPEATDPYPYEGPAVIEAVDGEFARVRLDNGRVIVGVRRARLRGAP